MSTPETYVVGDTKDFTVEPLLDGAAWNMTGGAVTFYLRNPVTGATASFSASIVSPGTTAQYVTLTTDLSVAGKWERWWKIVVAGVQETMPAVTFDVVAVP